ncbi:nucleotidyltransferase family protein [Bacillus sp. FJAT-29790]|uniref:nucleotidyltransferase family protein n=1 Tax=Bacillus sp. FJAT-29790 TaxID=1895002 RepID=UPI001C217669|nr:nucleotidyltransferase family protein [Bacillus sp. FJAT-29790]MBU8878569.1 nucleotidyltransferase family protein [Bacillus sp. FJAT-29790]
MGATAILLAAGQSTRMGCLKGMLPWHEKTLFEHQLIALEKSTLSEIIVVLGYEAERFLKIVNNYSVKAVYNKNYHIGKVSSILTGLNAVGDVSESILILAVDQPTETEIINNLVEIQTNSNCPIAVPVYDGKRGHPVVFSRSIINDLLAIKEETKGLRTIFQKYEKKVIEAPINNPLIRLNLNTIEDYQNAVKEHLSANLSFDQ